jgi:glucose/arabinose dehydrogenase
MKNLWLCALFLACSLAVTETARAQESASPPQPQTQSTAAPPAQAATPASTAAPAAPPAPAAPAVPAGKLLLREGTEVKLKFLDAISSKTATEGDPVNLELDEPLNVGDVVVVKPGAKAVGEVTKAKKAGMMGRAGDLSVRLDHLVAGDTRVKLRGSKGKEGEGKEGTAVALTVLFGPIGLIKHGKNVEVKPGTPLTAYVDEDVALAPAQ